MLNDEELETWLRRLGLSGAAQAEIRQVRGSEPSRHVHSGRSNVSGRYPSKKMGVTIQFESHRVELAAIYEIEHDSDVLEYYDQPPSIRLEYKSPKGRRLVVQHTPDYFVIRQASAGWEECKTEEDLHRLAEESPTRYCAEGEDWRCPPGEAYARQLGLYYRIRSSRDISWVFQRNIQFLEDYFGIDPGPSPAICERVLAYAEATPGVSVEDLIMVTEGFATPDDIYALIAESRIYVDLHAEPLAEPRRVQVFPTASAASVRRGAEASTRVRAPASLSLRVGEMVKWDGTIWRVVNVGERTVGLLGDEHALIELPVQVVHTLAHEGRITEVSPPSDSGPESEVWLRLSKASERDLKEANKRLACVGQYLGSEELPLEVHLLPRTTRRWAADYRRAERVLGCGYIGLLPKTSQRGNSVPKLSEGTRALMTEFIDKNYETLKQKSIMASWQALRLACEKAGSAAPTYKTFRLAIRQRPRFDQVLKRCGRRAAYQHEPFYWKLELITPRHGDRPFEIGHIDHTELDVECVCSSTGRVLGRPWMTLLTDAFSRRVLAAYLTFDPPSYRSCMMVLRECVRRQARLPQIVVVDGGPEFKGTYFETLLARYHCTKKTRPGAKARFGAVLERLFGVTNKQFVHNLRGNTQITRNVRQVTKGVNPKQQAVWPLKELDERLREYLYEIYETRDHPALGQTAREAFESGLARTGHRLHRIIPYDRELLIYTLPAPLRETAKVIPGRGVKIHYVYYWCDRFRDPMIEKRRVAVRYDPFNAGSAFAFVHDQWVECHSEYYAVFQGRSEKEVMLASQELRKQQQSHHQNFAVNSRKLAEFLESVEAEEALLLQRLRNQEARRLQSESHAVGESIEKKREELSEDTAGQVQGLSREAESDQPCETYEEL